MSTQFNKVKASYFKKLEHYVPIVDRVHGGHHPEFHEVRKVFNSIVEKIKISKEETPDLNSEFSALNQITDSYKVPEDVCETYEAVYEMLSKVDRAYQEDIAKS